MCGQGFQGSGIKEDDDVSKGSGQSVRPPRPTKTTTAIPIDVTTRATTRRPPRVKSNIRLAGKNPSQGVARKNKVGNKVSPNQVSKSPPVSEVPEAEGEDQATTPSIDQGNSITDDRSTDPFRNPPLLSADGKKPRVKSNLKANKAFAGPGVDQDRGRNRVNAVTDNIQFVDDGGAVDDSPGSSGPEVRPDGRPPRVKANLDAGKQLIGQPRVPDPFQVPVEVEDNPGTDFPLVEAGPPIIDLDDPLDTTIPTQRPFQSFSTKRPEGPRVKSNIVASQRNKFRGSPKPNNLQGRPQIQLQQNEGPRSGGLPANEITEAPPNEFTQGVKNFLAQVPVDHQPKRPPLQPQFIDEIDEFEVPNNPTEPPQETTTFLQPVARPQIPNHQPRVKANILASRPGKNGPKSGQRVPVNQDGSSEVVELGGFDDEDDGAGGCNNNPFKCPPTQVADGRKPRVKSNIKASSRNFFFPNGKTNRIKGKAKPDRAAFNQFLSNLRTRKGKASRGRNKNNQNVSQNDFDLRQPESSSEEVTITTTTTENLLQVLLHQIKEEQDPGSIVQPKRPKNPRVQPVKDNVEFQHPRGAQSTRKPFRHSQRRPLPQEFADGSGTFIPEVPEDLGSEFGEQQATTPLVLLQEEEDDYEEDLALTTSTFAPTTTTTTSSTTTPDKQDDLIPTLPSIPQPKDPQFPTPQVIKFFF